MAGRPRSGCQHGQVLMRDLFGAVDCQLLIVSSHGGNRVRELSGVPFRRALTPFMTAPPSWPNHLPKVLSPNTITAGVRIFTYEFWKDTNIQSIATGNTSFCYSLVTVITLVIKIPKECDSLQNWAESHVFSCGLISSSYRQTHTHTHTHTMPSHTTTTTITRTKTTLKT